MIDLRVRRRDRYSLEIKSRHLFQREPGGRPPDTRVRTSIYFFLPYSFNIRPETFDEERFFQDIKLYVRFDTPRLTVDQVVAPGSETSPLRRLGELLGRQPLPEKWIVYELKLFGALYKSLLRDATRHLRSIQEPALSDLSEYCSRLDSLAAGAARLRELGARVERDTPLGRAFRLVDEYILLCMTQYATSALKIVGEQNGPAGECLSERILSRHEALESLGYPTGRAAHDQGWLEEYIYRLRVLKHYCASVLFLQVRRKNQSTRVEHLLYAIAAGIAMAVATAVSFLSQVRLGGVSTTLFLILVGSYMVKDRLKDLMRSGFQRTFGRFFYDRRTVVSDTHLGAKLGVIKERVVFVDPGQLDERVTATRARGRFEREVLQANPESVLEYDKVFRIRGARLLEIHNRVRGVADINILDVKNFLRYLTRQREIVGIPADGSGVNLMQVDRIYHLNLVIDCRSGKETMLQKVRLVVGSSGIRRVETIGDT